VIQNDLFESDSPAIILPYDGMNRRFEGNLISAFRKLYEDCEEIERKVETGPQVALGKINPIAIEDFRSFQYLVLVSTHGHLAEDADIHSSKSFVSSAVARSLEWALHNQLPSVASAVMSGGWRLRFVDAIYAMIAGVERIKGDVTLLICVPEEEDYEDACAIVHQAGFR